MAGRAARAAVPGMGCRMKVMEPGHTYKFNNYDGGHDQVIVFVKRCEPQSTYPGNNSAHPGTLMQELLRACIDRAKYVNEQIPSEFTQAFISDLRMALWRLEARAAQRHGRILMASPHCIENLETCNVCGHIECPGHKG
jgi:hypothetical protein